GVLKAGSHVIDHWSLTSLHIPRGDNVEIMAATLPTIPHTGTLERYTSVHAALNVIMPTQQSDTLLIV
ncbi:bifunctional tetrahydrofolate synthase/dihydrofolate synthase, partial [Pseudoalteromonas sp. S979]